MAAVTRLASAYAGGEAMRVVKSKVVDLVADTGNVISLIPIPAKAFIHSVQFEITEAIDDGGTDATMDIGFTGNGETADPDYFHTDADATQATIGIYNADTFQSKYFGTSKGMITTSPVKGQSTTGKYRVFVTYTVIH